MRYFHVTFSRLRRKIRCSEDEAHSWSIRGVLVILSEDPELGARYRTKVITTWRKKDHDVLLSKTFELKANLKWRICSFYFPKRQKFTVALNTTSLESWLHFLQNIQYLECYCQLKKTNRSITEFDLICELSLPLIHVHLDIRLNIVIT